MRGLNGGDGRLDELLYRPNYTVTDEIISLIAQLAARVDVLTIQSGMDQNPKLRRLNRLRSIHSSLGAMSPIEFRQSVGLDLVA